MLRDKFLEAGFILSESKNGLPAEKKDPEPVEEVQASQCKDLKCDENPLLEELTPLPPQVKSISAPEILDPYAAALARKPKPRPLLLHATLVNTIYVRGRRNFGPGNNGKNGRNGPKRFEFDARGLLARYRSYYVDETQRVARVDTGFPPKSSTKSSLLPDSGGSKGDEIQSDPDTSASSHPRHPFVWAKDIPINSVSICEMGAKKLEVGGPGDRGLNARLGEEYTVIAERSLDSRPRSRSPFSGDIATRV
jgi:activating signal cointegrator complex subunit 1